VIYTVTFNPSLDYIVRVTDFKPGIVNRTDYEEILPGGKGINVSIVLKNLGINSIALGYVAGFTGREIEKRVSSHGCTTDFIKLTEGLARINIKLKSTLETEINGKGPAISNQNLEQLFQKLDCLEENDILVLAGSIPATLPEDIYEKIMLRLSHKNIRIVVDATKDLLVNVLKYQPFLIKPNIHELGEIFNVDIKDKEEAINYGLQLQLMGARNVIVSMAGEGAVLIAEGEKILRSKAPTGKVVNSVGAGDSMVAGFLTGYLTTKDLEYAFKMGIATGSASAFSDKLAVKEDVLKLMEEML